jgi:hypothetical protein
MSGCWHAHVHEQPRSKLQSKFDDRLLQDRGGSMIVARQILGGNFQALLLMQGPLPANEGWLRTKAGTMSLQSTS